MDELSSGVVDPEELMDLDEGEASELDEDEEDVIEDTLPSPLQLPSSGPASTATSAASSPPTNDDTPPVFNFTGKPLNIKRGRGRPRREGGKPVPRRQSSGVRMKRWKPQGFSGRGIPKRVKSFDRDYDSPITPSPGEEMSLLDPETGALILNDRDKGTPHNDELPYASEQWPGKVCGFCNLGERSQLGQGEMLRLTCPEGFIPRRIISEMPDLHTAEQVPDRDTGDKSPRGPVTCRRQKSFNKCRHPSMTSEYVDELTIIGYTEEPDVTTIFEPSSHFYVHRSCSLWSNGVIRKENMGLENVGQALLLSASKKCSHCNHYGASISCKREGCTKVYHFPCATASGAFQELFTLLLFCSNHLMQVALLCEGSVCFTCKSLGDISNLMYCSNCGEHYHGTCVGLAQLPGVRAGWQCRKCRVCQVCRIIGDETKLMACEQCDKVYHAMCQRPVVTSIPKYGWKCRCCRVCGDCGSRTPGAGLSSRWHSHYTVCDSCYQQRNKGYSCPLCHRAYRAHAYREMVQCALCRKFVHGTCDPEADLTTYHQRKEIHPEYEYVCSICKNRTQQGRPMLCKRNSTEDPGDSLSASQESLYDDVYEYDPDRCASEDSFRGIGLGRGKPYSASKIAKKRLGLTSGVPGRPKGIGKGLPGKVGFMKRQRLTDFGRKRGPKAKMRGIFGVPGVGLQRPVSDGSKADDEPGVENRLILCSAKDKFVLTQDICVMCGALGTDQEGCLIACVQCGQCYHPYCVNVKVTKVILQKGWRCLDCTVCEGCGQKNDESRLLLCDDCDISYHIYCMDPPLDYVPQGNWKCKWCVICQTCGSTDPGFNCNWMNSFSECGPCASHHICPSCMEPYNEGDLIIQCVQCERWLHGSCDSIRNEIDAEKCAEDGYNCVLCRPRDVPPPHLLPVPVPKPPSPTKSPEIKSNAHFYVDGVYLSEVGHSMIKSLCLEQQIGTRKKRKKISSLQDKEAGIMATIESVIAGSSGVSDNGLEDNAKLELVDVKEEPQELYKEGMLWAKEDGPPPDGFTLFTMENGMTVLRRKRQRNLQKLGIGGFFARIRGVRSGQDNDDMDLLTGQSSTLPDPLAPPSSILDEKPRRKPIRRKPKSKLVETFPPYLQEAFFGKELLDSHKDLDSTSGSEDDTKHQMKSIQLSQDEIKAVAAVTAKQDNKMHIKDTKHPAISSEKAVTKATIIPKEEEESDNDDLSFALPRDLLDTDLVNTIMNEDDDELTKNTDTLENLAADAGDISDTLSGTATNSKDTKDELSDILGPHFNLETIPNINSKDVEDILFKGVLTDESQESQESSMFSNTTTNVFPSASIGQQPLVAQHPISAPAVRPSTLPNVVNQNSLSSPLSFPPQSPYQSEYSNSPQFSPAFSEPPSPWVTVGDGNELDNTVTPSTYNQRSSEKMKADEGLGSGATISAVLYANMNHPEWKNEFPSWSDRYKQIIKKWRTLSPEQKAPYLLQAKDNRSALRMKKQQQISNKEGASTSGHSPGMVVPQSTAKASPITSSMSPSVGAQQLPTQQQQPSQLPTTIIQNTTTTYQHHQHLQKDQVPAGANAPSALTTSEDPEKSVQQQKSAREAEQERQWKQLQALRQQQQQHQQQIIQEQRVQVAARVHRQISDNGSQQFIPPDQTVLSGSPQQEISSPHLPTSPRTFNTLSIKSPPTFTHPSAVAVPRPHTPSQQEFTAESGDPFSPTTTNTTAKTTTTPSNMRLPIDPYIHQPSTPRPVPFVTTPRPTLQGVVRQDGGSLEINHRQLKDLLQRQQQFKKLDEQLLPGKGQQRVWPPENTETVEQVLLPPSPNEPTFRHPLPPAMRPRIPLPTSNVIRQPGNIVGLRMPVNDPRLQGLRLILHQQQQQRTVSAITLPQQFAGGSSRFPQSVTRPVGVEQYEQLQRQVFQPRNISELQQAKLNLGQQLQKAIHPSSANLTNVAPNSAGETASTDQEIPDNVTAELEKLEQDSTMVELQGVSDLLGGLPEDDDELLAEMGNDFNILEYADPELDTLTGGEKTNILDSLDLVESEPVKEEKKLNKNSNTIQTTVHVSSTTTNPIETKTEIKPLVSSAASNLELPQLSVSQQQTIPRSPQSCPTPQPQLASQQQIHQQMLQHVQQAAAEGRPFLARARVMTRDGVVSTVTANNNVTLNLSAGYQQQVIGAQLQQLQIQKLQMRQNAMVQNTRLASPVIHGTPSRINVAGPPPPPPYPGPPPPYPGSTPSQEQPLLLQELLEEEQREQEKQLQTQTISVTQNNTETSSSTGSTALLSDHEFERLKADVLNSGPLTLGSNTTTITPVQSILSSTTTQARPTFQTQVSNPGASQNQWQTLSAALDNTPRVPTFNANFVPAPPLPPEHIVTEQDKQIQIVYEQWLNHQNMVLGQQLKFYESEVQKLRKIRKSLNSKQRQLKKCGNQLAEADASELQRISSEQSILQKHLESSRKQTRQHGLLIQEYRNKQQAKQRPVSGQSPLLSQSPLGPPASSPIHPTNTPQSPLLSPTASPMAQHSSPMHSPAPLVSHSPGPGSVSSVLQSPGNQNSGMSPMQPSPRIGTPHSQSEGSPGPVQSPSQICLPPPIPRMTSPQHRRVVTSPLGYVGDLRPGTPQGQLRFARPQLDAAALQQRTRLQSPSPSFQQKPCTQSPLNSPPTQQLTMNQQMLQRHLQQQSLLQQQQQSGESQGDCTLTASQRTLQLIQQRQLALRQQQLVQQQVSASNQPQPLTPQQHQLMIQQQQQLAKQQQQQIAQLQAQQRLSQHNQPPSSPMPPSPHVSQPQIMSPHSMQSQPASPMPPRSPMISSSPVPRSPAIHQTTNQHPSSPMMHSVHQPPSSPMPRSPMLSQIQSPMGMRRPPSTGNSPILPDRPKSTENPGTPRNSFQLSDHDHSGGGNPHNPSNPIPFPPSMGRFGYYKLGLRGGSPMWSYGRGAKRLPGVEGKEDKPSSSEIPSLPPKFKKESHVSRVTILKKKSPVKSNLQGLTRVNSLVSSDYNEFDDSSSTPPITPPPSSASTSTTSTPRSLSRSVGKKLPCSDHQNEQLQVVDRSPEEKQLSIMDYDDDTVISTEVSLSSAAQQPDCDEITVIESFNQSGLESFSSPLESDQITEDFLLFDISENVYPEKEVDEDDHYHMNDKNVRYVIQSPTTSDEELIIQEKSKESDGLTLNLVEGLSSGQALPIESPTEPEEPHIETTTSDNFDDSSHVVIIDPTMKSPEEISTKEDFEELIDEGSRKEKIIKSNIMNSKHINEIHKYAAPSVYTFAPKTTSSTLSSNIIHTNLVQTVRSNTINIRPTTLQGQKISLITSAPVIANSNLTSAKINKNIIQHPKVQNNIASIILPIKTTLRSNILGVPKIVNSVAPITIVSGSTTQIASILPSQFTVPVISASAVSKLPNVKVIDKPSTSLSLTSDLPKKIFEDDSKSPDSSNCDDDKLKLEQHLNKLKEEQQAEEESLAKGRDTKEPSAIVNEDIKKSSDQKGVASVGGNVKSPAKNKNASLIIHNPPELKMTAQIIQESQNLVRSATLETMPFITQTVEEVDGNSNDLDNKSVVISIPSPTPSQEQILDHISLQALENRRQDGKFEYFDSLLEMIEDMDMEEIKKSGDEKVDISKSLTKQTESEVIKITADIKETTKIPVTIVTSTRATVMPQLSPLSQPSELTSNIANGSQQLRTLLSSFTTTVSSSSNVGTTAKTVTHKEKAVNLSTTAHTSRIVTQQQQHQSQHQQHQQTQHQQQQQTQQQQARQQQAHHQQHQQQQAQHQQQQQPQHQQQQQPQHQQQHQQQQQQVQHQQQQQSPHQLQQQSQQQQLAQHQQQQQIQHSQQQQTQHSQQQQVQHSQQQQQVQHQQQQQQAQHQQQQQQIQHQQQQQIQHQQQQQIQQQQQQTQLQQVYHQQQSNHQQQNNAISSVIVPNIKKNIASPKTSPTSTVSITTANIVISSSSQCISAVTSTTQSILSTKSIDHQKLPLSLAPCTTITSSTEQKVAVSLQSSTGSTPVRKPSLSLNEMLQSHPAATVPQTSPGTITTASILGSALPLSRTGFSAALVQAQPNVISSVTSSINVNTNPFKPTMGTTNLLHSQLTKSLVSRTRSFDEIFEKRIEKEAESVITENSSITNSTTQAASSLITTSSLLKDAGGCKFSNLHSSNRLEDSQNVLLKQLLQNTACASLQTTTSTTVSTTMSSMTAPSLPIVPNLEAQLARPVPPTPSTLIPPILQNDAPLQQQTQPPQHHHQQQQHISPINSNNSSSNITINNNNNNISKAHPTPVVQRQPIMTRETSFVSKPVIQNIPTSLPIPTSQALHIDIKKALPPSRTPSRDDLLSPPTPRSTCSQDSNITTPPLVIKKEPNIPTTLQSPLLTPQEVKKEFVDDSSQHSEISDQSKCDMQLKEELMDIDTEKMDKEELKKMKRRMYQQKRRQNQILNKEIAGQPKKRPRKSSKVDEDYDSYIEGVLAQLRTLPPMIVSEPVLNKNFGVVPVVGSGDFTKLGCKDYDSRFGDLKGSYGNAEVPGCSDYYSTKPYGDFDPLPEKPPSSTQRGFYDQEFALIKFDTDDDKRFDFFSRDDSPDSVISSSSPECPVFEPILKFPGLKLIDDDSENETSLTTRPVSPVVPIIAPIPIRLKPSGAYLKDFAELDKENIGKDYHTLKPKFAPTHSTPLKDSGNVTVTLTLTSSAAEDIMGVLRDLANILHIPAPTSYQIVERTSTPPSQKLGLYRTKGKDGKEGAPIDIQSILNGAAKFCKHCDVVILNNMIRKKISELPFLSKDSELLGDGEELFFCSTTCYMQFALMHRSPSLTEDKAAAIVDHLCQKDKADHFRKRQVLERQRSEIFNFENITQGPPPYLEKLEYDLHIKKEDFSDDVHLDLMKSDCYLERSQKFEDQLSKWRNLKYKRYTPGCLQPRAKYKKASDKETIELLYKLGITVSPLKNMDDIRRCMFCHTVGDGVADGPARLLNFDVDKWVHLNCALWSDGVYETVNGALMHLENALQQSLVSTCVHCNNFGATVRCFKTRCSNIYHLSCAIKDRCVFYKNKTTYCMLHVPKNEKDNELTTLSVSRRVYVNRDENRQVAAVMHHSDQNNLLRVGSLIFLSVGQLMPHQLQNFHTANYIYPIGYKIVRFYWSMKHVNKRCRYICSIHEISGRPEFRILVQEALEEDMEYRDVTARGVWSKIVESIANLRKENQCVHVFTKYVTGEDLFGLTEPAVVRVLESLPGIETLTDYKFKYGRNPLLELPLAINPSGAARTEPRLRNQLHWKRAHTQRTGSSARPVFAPTAVGTGEVTCPYSKQFVHSKSSQYKKMKQEWRNNVYLARSKIQGLGLYAARDLEKHTMVIEYIGEIIRTELAETREKKYEAKNRGIYMFRLDEERVVDATLCGGLARYINHSCNPNCVAEIVEVDRDLRIIIFAKRRIQRGEELAYDYKFDIEDDQHKISCMCGAPNCRKWMN